MVERKKELLSVDVRMCCRRTKREFGRARIDEENKGKEVVEDIIAHVLKGHGT